MKLSVNKKKQEIKVYISIYKIDCVDNFSSSHFNFTSCSDSESLLKCDTEGSMNFGRCFKSALVDGSLANCSMDRSLLEQTGFWKTSFPSQDYWK